MEGLEVALVPIVCDSGQTSKGSCPGHLCGGFGAASAEAEQPLPWDPGGGAGWELLSRWPLPPALKRAFLLLFLTHLQCPLNSPACHELFCSMDPASPWVLGE